ncbi:SecY-interacting protein [Erwinia endophytica]|uniref:SecY-interacting protein n=1 Tax=Erwinia endophytica TaxID=1563158 RepID=UPI001265FB8B|nr:SecY-interacting protein [Erwinia endophytica]KAB8305264.1 SecY-interacting protein [Erwinia endophytica]
MIEEMGRSLTEFTRIWCESWQQECGHAPASRELYGVPSPCIQRTGDDEVFWLPQPFTLAQNLDAVGRALDFQIQPSVVAWYTSQFAGDMAVNVAGYPCTLLQTWSEDDFVRLQENLIGHLVMKRRLKHSPTLFIATTASELEVISICNLSGEVILEQPGSPKRTVLADNLMTFISSLTLPAKNCGKGPLVV